MDMETLGYFLYMEEVEKEQMQQDQAEYGKVNVNFLDNLVGDQTTQDKYQEKK